MWGKTINIQVAKTGVVGYTGIMLYMVTSGFSYDDWAGHFYPPHLPRLMPPVAEVTSSIAPVKPDVANNHRQAQAVNTIRQLRLMLD